MTTITAKSLLASEGDKAPRLDTMLLRYPRCIHSEFMTHRVFSRNAASSRAIPVSKLIDDVMTDPFVPVFWGKNQKGMQAFEEYSETEREVLTNEWLWDRDAAVERARHYEGLGCHKQIVNRLLEPFAHITVVVTGTQWSNFLALRNHRDAEPHMQLLAGAVHEAYAGAHVQHLNPGEFHLPFVEPEDWEHIYRSGVSEKNAVDIAIKLSVARCASTSYKTVDGFDMTIPKAIELHDKLVASTPLHASPCEHQAQVDPHFSCHSTLGGNLGHGWIQYRKTLEGECL